MNQQEEQDILDSEEFYELMQTYRHTPVVNQTDTTLAFEAVKGFIRAEIAKAEERGRIEELDSLVTHHSSRLLWTAKDFLSFFERRLKVLRSKELEVII